MELRVNVDGIERSVSGITENTTCAQIIYALAHATGQKGRFVLIEKFRNTERSLAPLDRPLGMLQKWGRHSRCVTFVLKHLDDDGSPSGIYPVAAAAAAAANENSQLDESTFITSVDESRMQTSNTDNNAEDGGATCFTVIVPSMSDQLHRPDFRKVSQQTMPTGRLRIRPPPPAYHEVIEQRFTSLSRQNTPSTSLTPLQSPNNSTDDQWHLIDVITPQPINMDNSSILTKKLSIIALEEMIESQKQIIEQQKAYLTRLDLAINDDQQREVIQMRRQQENLRVVLNPLRDCDWPNRLQYELIELQKITSSITDLKQKLDIIASEIRLRIEEEHSLQSSILATEEELKQLEDDVNNTILSHNNH